MKQEFRTAVKGIGRTTLAHALYSRDGVLLTSAEDNVRQWKEFFEGLLNPTDTSSVEEAESED